MTVTKVKQNIKTNKTRRLKKKKKKTWAHTYNTFLGWWWNDAAMERLLDRQLLIKTQEVTVTPSHREGFTPEHGQRGLKVEAQNMKNCILRNTTEDLDTY